MNLKTRYATAIVALLIGLPLAAYFAQAVPALAHKGFAIGDLYSHAVGSVLSFTALDAAASAIYHSFDGWTLGGLLFWSVVGGTIFACAVHTWDSDCASTMEAVHQKWIAAIKANNSPEVIAKFQLDYRTFCDTIYGSEERRVVRAELEQVFPVLVREAAKIDTSSWNLPYQAVAFLGAVFFSFGSPGTFAIGWLAALIVMAWAIYDPKDKLELEAWAFIAKCS